MTRRWWVIGALAAAVSLSLAAAGALVVRGSGDDVLAPWPGPAVFETEDAQVGTSYEYGLDGFTNTSAHRVTFTDVRPTTLTPGIVVDAIRAIDNCRQPRMSAIGAKAGRIEQTNPELPLHPIGRATIDAHSESCWYFLITVRPTQRGLQSIHGFEVVYRVNGRTERHHVPFGLELHVTGSGNDPRATEHFPLYT